MQIVWSP